MPKKPENERKRSGDEAFGKGDRVSWRSHGSTAEGTVRRRIEERTQAGGRTVNASPDAPQYEVESEKSGGRAVHKPGALHREGRGGGGKGKGGHR